MAALSRLSRQAYLKEDINSMFMQLYRESVFTLLFLKSIISLEMYVWDDGSNEPQKLYSCSISSHNEITAWHRQAILRFSNSSGASTSDVGNFFLEFMSESLVSNIERRVDKFFIVQKMAPPSSRIGVFASTAAKEYDLHLLPWASVAACVSDDFDEASFLRQGQAFCSLPLPVSTGLPVQVNGFFEISSNRRSIWYGADMDRAGKLRSDWNRLLLEDVVAPAFNELLLGLCKLFGPSEIYYSMWPTGSFEEPWNILVKYIYRIICLSPVLYSESGGGRWLSLSEAFIHDREFSKSKVLADALVSLGMPITHVPDSLIQMLKVYSTNFSSRVVNPAIVRNFLRNCKALDEISRSYRLVLLDYCLSDLDDADVGKTVSGLHLIPLENGQFGIFSEASKGISFFVCNELEYELFKVASERIVDRGVPSELFNRLLKIAGTSSANISFISDQVFLQFFPRFVPVAWKYKNSVFWDPESVTSLPTPAWFKLFWQYLRDQPYSLSLFHEWPILPTVSGYLYRASKSSKLIKAELLSHSMKELLGKLGCKILAPNYGVEHRELSLYVYDGNASGILNSIFEAFSSNDDQLHLSFQDFSADERFELCRFLLDPKWYLVASLSDLDIKKCKRLPIFRLHSHGDSNIFKFSDLESSRKYLPPVGISEYLLGDEFIYCVSKNDEDILVRYYGIQYMKKVTFYKQNVLSMVDTLQPDIRDSVMLAILHDLPQLCSEDSSFREYLKMSRFVPTISGSLKSPQSLYDPRIEHFGLLEESDCFPSGVYQETGVLDMLLLLGLQTSISADTIIQSARQIESLVHKDQVKAHIRGKVLLSYLEVNAVKWVYNAPNYASKLNAMFSKINIAHRGDGPFQVNLEKFWNDLRMICWCPVLVTSPHPGLPWPSVSSMVAPPKMVRLQGDMWLVSASTRILDGECSSTLSFCLGWSAPPGGSVIAAQLLELGKNNEVVIDQSLRQELALAMPKMYSLLTNLIGSDEMDIVKVVLEGCRWIWVGDGFATADEVVLSGHLHLAPYMRVIPVDLAVFRELFLELGIKEFLKPLDYANILFRIAARKDRNPLDGQELRVALLVVQYLAEVQFQDLQVPIYLPDASCRLLPSTDLVYNDAPWLLDSEESTSRDTTNVAFSSKRDVHNFVHGNISNDLADKLGVCSLRRLLLAESSDSMNLSLSGVAEVFGQHEALTTRLKHIVEMYADGPGILFELVQNAEDAQASEVVFLLDKTQYGTSSVLSPEMAEWQGPALYCFNNSIFTSQDLYAISRVGQDSKLDKPFAIGRFGLGFNCVYHFTDIPCFVSGENLVIFDPHASYLPGISPSHPGLRIRFVGRRILEQFPDQFTPFLHFGCDLQKSFPGTLFRFPLRNEYAASRSQIKKEKYAPEDVESLFSSFREVASETLLFLRYVKKIALFVKHEAGQEMQLIHSVSRNVNGLVKEPHPFYSMLNFIHGSRQSGMDMDQFTNKLSKIEDKDLPWSCQKVAIVEESVLGHVTHLWFVSESIGGGHARKKFIEVGNKTHKLIPWASVAAYLTTVKLTDVNESNDFLSEQLHGEIIQGTRKVDGKAFCFLPLPIVTGLPVHVNAYFELSSNRRDIWFGNDMSGGGKVRSEWNMCLLEDAIAPAFVHLVASIAQNTGPSNLFFSFWPTAMGVEPWASMVRKFYQSIVDLGLPILFTKARGGQWISTKQAILPDYSYTNAENLAETLAEAGLPMVSVSKQIVERFIEACPSLHFLSPQLLRTLLIRRKREFKNKDAVIMTLDYCLSDMSLPAFYGKLHGLPLITLANGSLATISKHGEGERIFVTSQTEFDLLKEYVPQLLVDCSIPDGVARKLNELANSGELNIQILTCSSLVELFPRIFPPEWQYMKQVSWNPDSSGHPNVEWMRLLWKYIRVSCTDLTLFSKWPILPVGNGHLLQLLECSNVIRDEGWTENMHSLLQKLGCFFLRSDITIDHPQLKLFVQDATMYGVLNAISANASMQSVNSLFGNISMGEKHEFRNYILQSKWYSGNELSAKHIDIIKMLPIFECYKSKELASLSNPIKWLKPEGVNDDLLDANFIQAESVKERNILKVYLGIKEQSKSEFYKNHVLNRMSEFLVQPSLLSAIFSDVNFLMNEDPTMKSTFSEVPFVLAANGTWKHPSRLYDPRIPGLHNLLHKEVFFPCEKFVEDEVLDSLVNLGLKRTLGFSALIDCARSASILHQSSNMDAIQYGRRLLAYLNFLGLKLSNSGGKERENEFGYSVLSNHDKSYTEESQEESTRDVSCLLDPDVLDLLSNFDHDKSEDEFWSEMKNTAWCPVMLTPPLQGLPWFMAENCMASPNMTRPKSQMWIVSFSMQILDADYYSFYVQEKLGWMDPPDIKVLCSQLVELSRSYHELKRQNTEHAVDVLLGKNIPLIYSYLQEYIGREEFKVVKEYLDGVPWVYIGDSFVSPKALAFDSPVKYGSYLYAVPSELSLFRALLSELGVRATFTAADYLQVLQRLKSDMKDDPLSDEQLSFVHRVLEAFVDCYAEKKVPLAVLNLLLIPDSLGVMMCASDLVYNDAPWMNNISSNAKHFVHSSISDDMARKLGVKSLGSLSLVDEQMTRDLPCMDYARICDLLALYGDNGFILFDILELADKCNTKKIEFIYDKRQHPRQSLLQQNLGEFQGSSLTVILEGATLSVEELCRLQLPPPWKIQGSSLQYGLGLISSYFICDLLTILSGGYFYIFDPLGLALPARSGGGPAARLFSLKDTDLIERFRDQFSPFLTEGGSPPSSFSTVIRIPLSSKLRKEEENDCKRVTEIFNRFMQHASSKLLFLKSILQVSLSTWEEGSSHQSLNYSVSIDPAFASLRNPFSEKKWRKFQISRLFSSSGATTKVHVVDIQVIQEGSISIDKWVIVLCLGSGQTRNMALDRRYLSYNLTPVAGVAAHISQNGFPVTAHTSSTILSPLSLSGSISMPVTVLGCFLVCHNGGRYLFNRAPEANLTDQQFDTTNHLIEAWNRELMLCVRDAYIELAVEFHKLKKDPLSSSVEPNIARAVGSILQAYGDRIYSFWPRSKQHSLSKELDVSVHGSNAKKDIGADWQSLVEHVIRPFYVSLVDLPVWQLYGGNAVKADEGMFLSQSGTDQNNLPPPSVCSFIKEHYPVFSVPCELVREIQAVGIKTREIKPKMVRDLLKNSSSVVLRSIETYIDVLEYSLSDVQLHQLSNLDITDGSGEGNSMQTGSLATSSRRHNQDGDALEIMTYFGKALYDFGRGVVEDISRSGSSSTHRSSTGFGLRLGQPLPSIVTELRGLPFPLATNRLTRIGVTELWIGDKEQQLLMHALADNFVHSQCLEKPVLSAFLHDETVHRFFKLRKFSAHLLTSNLRFVFGEGWVNQVTSSRMPWIFWNKSTDSAHTEPNGEWIRLFWKIFSDTSGEVSLIDDWPLIPALLDRPVLCRTKAFHLIFVPPLTDLSTVDRISWSPSEGSGSLGSVDDIPRDELMRLYAAAYESAKLNYPWLFSLISQFNIPLFDMSFLDCDLPRNFFPQTSQTLGKVVVSKLLAAKACGCFNFPVNLSNEDRERLFNLFASSNGSVYRREELDLLRELPIYRTVLGTYTRLLGSDQCTFPPSAFFHPTDGRCLSSSADTKPFLYALGVSELNDQDILVRFGLPEFEKKNPEEQEKILLYLYTNWKDLQLDPTIVNTLKETNFVRNANELCSDLFKPRDLFDPCDIILASIFSGERDRFPGESFVTNGWLQILKKTGLRTSLQADTLLECAKKLEMLGKESVTRTEDPNDFEEEFSSNANDVSFEIWSLADSLVQLLFANFAVLYENAFCDKLSNIAFVPAEKGFPSISGKKGGKRILSSYKEAALLKDWPLVWTSAPILVKQNVIPPEYSWGAFHLRSPPAFSTVLKHLQVVGKDSGLDTLAHWPISPGMMTVEDTFLEILKYLDKIWGTLSLSDIKELKKLAIVPVANGTRLVTAKSLFVRLTINLSPFVFELPSIYLPFVKILKEIGMHDALSVSFARDLLLSIQKSCGYQRLNPNELRAVLEVLNFICSEANQAISDEENWISSAIIPDDGCRLVLAKSCVYIDRHGSHFVNNIDTSRLRFAHPELPENILATFSINKLSDVVIEELHEESELEFLDQIGHVQLNRIKDKLLSQSLQDALFSLIKNISHQPPSFEGLSSLQIKNLIELIAAKLQFVQCLQTRFLLLPKRLDITKAVKHSPFLTEWQGTMKHRTLHFVEKSRSCVLVAEPPSFMAVYDAIAVAISQALGLPQTLPIGPLFACPDGSEREVIKVLRMGFESGNVNCEANNNGLLGKELLPQDALQIQFLPLRPFYAGEIVAWKTGREGEKLRYGRVPEDVKPSDGQAFYRFPIEIAPGKTQVLLSSHVFSFKSLSMADYASSLVGGSEDIGQNTLLHGQTSNNVGNGKIEIQTAKELQYGKVSAREMVQAVHDMLSAAGVNMDAEKQALLQTTLSLQEQLKESQVALLVEQEKADVASKEAEAARTAWSCRVCLSAEVNISIVPCGHVLCQRCSSAVSKCPFCRTQVSRTLKIFRP